MNQVDTVVQPDILVPYDENKVEESGVVAAPDLVIEILSPSTARNDLTVKFELYEQAAVKEYWVVHPDEKIIQVFKLIDAQFQREKVAGIGDVIEVSWLSNLLLDVAEIFV